MTIYCKLYPSLPYNFESQFLCSKKTPNFKCKLTPQRVSHLLFKNICTLKRGLQIRLFNCHT